MLPYVCTRALQAEACVYKLPYVCKRMLPYVLTHPRTEEAQGFFPQLDEFYFTTAEKKILGNCRCTVPNFMND
jgi:hypothetical protein